MKRFRLTWFDKEGNIHKVVLEGEEDSIDELVIRYNYDYIISLKELEL